MGPTIRSHWARYACHPHGTSSISSSAFRFSSRHPAKYAPRFESEMTSARSYSKGKRAYNHIRRSSRNVWGLPAKRSTARPYPNEGSNERHGLTYLYARTQASQTAWSSSLVASERAFGYQFAKMDVSALQQVVDGTVLYKYAGRGLQVRICRAWRFLNKIQEESLYQTRGIV